MLPVMSQCARKNVLFLDVFWFNDHTRRRSSDAAQLTLPWAFGGSTSPVSTICFY